MCENFFHIMNFFHAIEHFCSPIYGLGFVTKHHINLTLALNSLFSSFVYSQQLIFTLAYHNHVVIGSLYIYFCRVKQYQLLNENKNLIFFNMLGYCQSETPHLILKKRKRHILREKCPHSEFFWSAFSRIRTKYGDLQSKSLHYIDL